jgi:hypothetical protein
MGRYKCTGIKIRFQLDISEGRMESYFHEWFLDMPSFGFEQ